MPAIAQSSPSPPSKLDTRELLRYTEIVKSNGGMVLFRFTTLIEGACRHPRIYDTYVTPSSGYVFRNPDGNPNIVTGRLLDVFANKCCEMCSKETPPRNECKGWVSSLVLEKGSKILKTFSWLCSACKEAEVLAFTLRN
jgi:hypothetical protein